MFKHLSYKNAKDVMNVINNDKYNDKEYKKFKEMYTISEKINSTDELIKLINDCLK